MHFQIRCNFLDRLMFEFDRQWIRSPLQFDIKTHFSDRQTSP
ncbi:hypothetical protein CKA32_004750 [Geitlerinema sp. FC II]|nr:hypothetical protein CKA32_004750 [Geitlerinema sp. FC II]